MVFFHRRVRETCSREKMRMQLLFHFFRPLLLRQEGRKSLSWSSLFTTDILHRLMQLSLSLSRCTKEGQVFFVCFSLRFFFPRRIEHTQHSTETRLHNKYTEARRSPALRSILSLLWLDSQPGFFFQRRVCARTRGKVRGRMREARREARRERD